VSLGAVRPPIEEGITPYSKVGVPVSTRVLSGLLALATLAAFAYAGWRGYRYAKKGR